MKECHRQGGDCPEPASDDASFFTLQRARLSMVPSRGFHIFHFVTLEQNVVLRGIVVQITFELTFLCDMGHNRDEK